MTDNHVVGAYAAAPTGDGRREFYDSVMKLPGCTGLEVPLLSADYSADKTWLEPLITANGAHVITLIPATMEALRLSSSWGLASSVENGRRESVNFLREVRNAVEELTRAGASIVAVEVHSAPSRRADASAFLDSLGEIVGWEWCGAALAVEHCDAARVGRRPEKGFLSLEEELDVVRRIRDGGASTHVGLSINWGRSVIDERNVHGAVDQIAIARSADLLDGLMFSGAVDKDSDFGPAWTDAHAPLRFAGGSSGERYSLLTNGELVDSLHAAGDGLRFDGVKVSVRPTSAGIGERLATVRRIWRSFTGARK